jgi:myo-inositol-1(or 4)-monophosphatase
MYKQRMEFINRLAREAGTLTLEGFGQCDQMPKDGPDGYDIATEYDIRTEELVKGRILDEFGEPILGEEEGLIGDPQEAGQRLWIVDPIDGTFNYQRGLPLYAVSIAYCENGLPVCGTIFLPAVDELYFASKGSGAYLNGRGSSFPIPIGVSQEKETARQVISLAGTGSPEIIAAGARMGIPWRSMRLFLCAVSSMAHVAAGRIDAFTDTALSLWDCAAGDIIVQEAGGPACTDYQGTPIFPEYVRRRLQLGETGKFPCLAASNPKLAEELLRGVLSAAGYGPPGPQ